MMEAELDEHLGYDEYERSDNPDCRNGVKHKKLRNSYGEIPNISVVSFIRCETP